jgi:hypothetical protein
MLLHLLLHLLLLHHVLLLLRGQLLLLVAKPLRHAERLLSAKRVVRGAVGAHLCPSEWIASDWGHRHGR